MGRKSSPALADRVIWVTRPLQESEHLCSLIAAAGGKAVRLPVIEIQPVRQIPLTQATGDADLVIFTSRNAVNHAGMAIPEFYTSIRGKILLAVGSGTRRALEKLGVKDVICPEAGMGSEALLQLPQLQPTNVAGKRILIVRGVGGRALLERTLTGMGAEVKYLEVYQRGISGIDASTLAALWHSDQPDVIIITSVEGLRNLVNMTAADSRTRLFRTPLAVMSDRIGMTARDLGFIHKPAVATAASDAGLLQAIMSIVED